MIKKLLLLTLVFSSSAFTMQKPTGWGLNPLSGIGFTAETNETVQGVSKAVVTTSKVLAEGLSDTTANLTQALNGSTANITKALVGASGNIEKTITISTAEVCRSVNIAAERITGTANKLIDAGIPALNQNIQQLANNGIQTRLIIDPATIKTFCFSSTGVAFAMAGIALILYESYQDKDVVCDTNQKPATWLGSVKNFAKNRYVLGSASIAAGLCLIAKSTTL